MRSNTRTRDRRSKSLLKAVLQKKHDSSMIVGHESYSEEKAKAAYIIFNSIDTLRRTYLGQHNINHIYISLCKIHHIFKKHLLSNAESLRGFLIEQTSSMPNSTINRKLPLAWTAQFISLINKRQSLNQEIKDHKKYGRFIVARQYISKSAVDCGK
jgi:hypothetical protein